MAKRKRPSFIKDEVKQATCQTCNIMDDCGLYKHVINLASIKNKKDISDITDYVEISKREFGCTWHSNYTEDWSM